MLNLSTRRQFAAMLACALLSTSVSADSFDNLAKNLVKIRAQVEELQSQLDLDKQDHKNEISSLSSQITDLEVEKRRKSLVVEQLKKNVAELQESMGADNAEAVVDDVRPVLQATLTQLKAHVSAGLPFKTQERLQTFSDLEKQLSEATSDPKKVANKMWALIEDEIRLSKENGLYQQTIVLNDENRLADVAKIGMMYLYFKTRDDQVGMARQSAGQWTYQALNDPIAQQQVETLFDALKKQVRQGFFELPNPYKS